MEKDLDSISAKVLSKELKILEVNLLVRRETMKTKPVTAEYSITEYGEEIKPVIEALLNSGLKHRIQISNKNKSTHEPI